MKITKYLFGLALLALGMSMTSCDQENEGAIYTPASSNVSWEQKAYSTKTAEETIEVPIMISRATKDGELTVNYTVEASDPEVLSDDHNGKVNFAAGEGMATVKVKAANMEKGTTYTYVMTLDDASAAADENLSAIKTITIRIESDYTWLDGGTCKFYDFNFGDGVEGEVEVLKAQENPNIIKLLNPFLALYGEDPDEAEYFKNCDDIIVTFYDAPDASGNVGEIGTGLIMGEYTIEYLPSSYPNYCYFHADDNYYTVGHLIGVDGVPTYVGGFDFEYER